MLKKILSIAVMSSLFSSGALAEDLLAKITNGALSDTSKGVRVLSAEEERGVVGGVYTYERGQDKRISNYGATMRYTVYGQLNLTRDNLNEKDKDLISDLGFRGSRPWSFWFQNEAKAHGRTKS